VQAAGSEAVGGCVEEIGDFGSVRGERGLREEVVEESSVDSRRSSFGVAPSSDILLLPGSGYVAGARRYCLLR
jgi:hypothetical protein